MRARVPRDRRAGQVVPIGARARVRRGPADDAAWHCNASGRRADRHACSRRREHGDFGRPPIFVRSTTRSSRGSSRDFPPMQTCACCGDRRRAGASEHARPWMSKRVNCCPSDSHGDPHWLGRIVGLGARDSGPARAAAAHPRRDRETAGRPRYAARSRREWLALEPWTGSSINTVAGGADVQDLPLPVVARRRHRAGGAGRMARAALGWRDWRPGVASAVVGVAARRAGSCSTRAGWRTSCGRRARPALQLRRQGREREASRGRGRDRSSAFIEKARARSCRSSPRAFSSSPTLTTFAAAPHITCIRTTSGSSRITNAVPPADAVARRRLAGRLPAARHRSTTPRSKRSLGRRRPRALPSSCCSSHGAAFFRASDDGRVAAFSPAVALVWASRRRPASSRPRTASRDDAPGGLAWTIGCGFFAGAFLLTRLDARAVACRHPVRAARDRRCPVADRDRALVCAWRNGGPPQAGRSACRAHSQPAPHRVDTFARCSVSAGTCSLAWLVAALRAAAARHRAGARSIHGTHGFSGRRRRASGIRTRTHGAVRSHRRVVRRERRTAISMPRRTIRPPCRCWQVWSSLALGRWDDALMNLPWWLTGVALAVARSTARCA